MNERKINSVAVLGAGTMGSGIAAACAEAGCKVLLLDVTQETAEKGKQMMSAGRMPMVENPDSLELITTGGFDDSLKLTQNYDWICEAVVEDLEVKRSIFSRLDDARAEGSIVSTNTSGIPLRSICEGMSEQLRKDISVTHFFNPVKVMKLLELVPGEDTTPDVTEALSEFCRNRLNKGVVYAKDTVNFIGNRIGCFWMLAGFHKGCEARRNGVSIEEIDALMTKVLGIPSTGLYGLIDLVGLDVMDLVARNLEENLPDDDAGCKYLQFPAEEQAMLKSGQLGRKTKGGFFRVVSSEDGTKTKEVYNPERKIWQSASSVNINQDANSLMFGDDEHGSFVWSLVSETLCYAADLVPEISNDIVNVDRAMRWGFNWKQGPFELLDSFCPRQVIAKLEAENRNIPRMLSVLSSSNSTTFYSEDKSEYLGTDGAMHPVQE